MRKELYMSQTTAIVLAAGQGKRMNSKVRKQYLEIDQKPIIYYTLSAFEGSFVDKIVLQLYLSPNFKFGTAFKSYPLLIPLR